MKKFLLLIVMMASTNAFAKSVSMNLEKVECVKWIDSDIQCRPTKGTHSDPFFQWSYTNGYFCEVNVIYKSRDKADLSTGRIFEAEKSESETKRMLEENDLKYLRSLPACN